MDIKAFGKWLEDLGDNFRKVILKSIMEGVMLSLQQSVLRPKRT